MARILDTGARRSLAGTLREQHVTVAQAAFTMNSWDEQSDSEIEGLPKIARVFSTNTYTGEISGQSTVNYVIAYSTDDIVVFRGYEQIVGRLGAAEGSFMIEQAGFWKDSAASSTFTVVEGSGTGALEGLTGDGEYIARHGVSETPVTLRYTLPAR